MPKTGIILIKAEDLFGPSTLSPAFHIVVAIIVGKIAMYTTLPTSSGLWILRLISLIAKTIIERIMVVETDDKNITDKAQKSDSHRFTYIA